MCTKSCKNFGKNLKSIDINGKDILEIGSYNVNGTIKDYIMSLSPNKYVGTDMREGPCVDIVCNACELVEKFGKESFDVIISMDTFEHIEDWKKAISNIKSVCKFSGKILITTVSKGWGKHDFPYDYWRYEKEDMERIFSDCNIEIIEANLVNHTIFVLVTKPENFVENDLSDINLFAI